MVFDKMKEQLGNTKWKTLIAIMVLGFATWFAHDWVWGLLFLFYAFNMIWNRQAYLIEEIHWGRNPIVFSLVIIIWLGFGIMSLGGHFWPEIFYAQYY